ncbi:TPA: hypothetical protein DIS56_00635 [Candidatus Saccharibacteria bacterium]|nr:MAG: hypothetical protein A3F05_03050 [Candidatus Saccharibacteria bacterium RIFCSPHIGHO2_12_FULL_47_17]HCM51630.1 hypothetical protein [Candidatus Saccharibacteria bacterium]
MKTLENFRNGHGYSVAVPEPDSDGQLLIFPEDARIALEVTQAFGSCLVEAPVGTGKSHLVSDIGVLARSGQYEMPTLIMQAHISGGCKEGASNALRVLDKFADQAGNKGLVIVDNADYYGYSGSEGKRRYQCALKHVEVARFLGHMTKDPDAPQVCATAHNEEWQANHWLYGRREEDLVTPQAKALLDSFAGTYYFTGAIDTDTAESLLKRKFGERASEITQQLGRRGILDFLHASQIDPDGVETRGIQGEVMRIEEGRAFRTYGRVAIPVLATA